MALLSGLRALTVSGVALATTLTGVAVVSTLPTSDAAAIPAAAIDSPARALELSRAQDRPEIDSAATARAEALSATADRITQHDAELKAQEQAAAEAAAAEVERIKREFGYDPATKAPKEIARQIAANKYGWGADQFECYNNIIMRESRWDPFADNPTSSAYGIPQALPGKRMASHGADWKTNPVTQIRWGLDYVKERFGTPCKAWSFKRAKGWY